MSMKQCEVLPQSCKYKIKYAKDMKDSDYPFQT